MKALTRLWKIKWKYLKKTKRKTILNKVKTLKEILFQKCDIPFSEATTETCSGKLVLWNPQSKSLKDTVIEFKFSKVAD